MAMILACLHGLMMSPIEYLKQKNPPTDSFQGTLSLNLIKIQYFSVRLHLPFLHFGFPLLHTLFPGLLCHFATKSVCRAEFGDSIDWIRYFVDCRCKIQLFSENTVKFELFSAFLGKIWVSRPPRLISRPPAVFRLNFELLGRIWMGNLIK